METSLEQTASDLLSEKKADHENHPIFFSLFPFCPSFSSFNPLQSFLPSSFSSLFFLFSFPSFFHLRPFFSSSLLTSNFLLHVCLSFPHFPPCPFFFPSIICFFLPSCYFSSFLLSPLTFFFLPSFLPSDFPSSLFIILFLPYSFLTFVLHFFPFLFLPSSFRSFPKDRMSQLKHWPHILMMSYTITDSFISLPLYSCT